MSDVNPAGAQLRGAVDLSGFVNPAPAGTATQAPGGASGLVFDGTDQNFQEFLEVSMQVPVIVDLWAEWCGPCKQLSPVLEKLTAEYGGKFVLVKVDVDSNPQLTQAFQAQSIPTVAALIAGRPMALFQGALPEQQVREVLDQVLQVAAQNGVTETAKPQQARDEDAPEPEPEPLPPLHQEAYDAIERGDFAAAISAYQTQLAQDPRDTLAQAGLAQVSLLARLEGADAAAIRQAAAERADDIDAQLAVADLDVSGGHLEDAFGRLLDLFSRTAAAERNPIRERLIEYFELTGPEDPRVIKARGRLASLLY